MPFVDLRSTGFVYKVIETDGGIFSLLDEDDYLIYRTCDMADLVSCCLICSFQYRDFNTIELLKYRPEFRKEFNKQKNSIIYSKPL